MRALFNTLVEGARLLGGASSVAKSTYPHALRLSNCLVELGLNTQSQNRRLAA